MNARGTMLKTKVVVDRDLFVSLHDRLLSTERLVVELRDQRDQEHAMLIVALTQLATATRSPDRAHFIRRWLREYRGEPESWNTIRSRRRRLSSQG